MNRSSAFYIVSLVTVYFTSGCSPVTEVDERFEANLFVNSHGDSLYYRIFVPESYNPETNYPVVLFLHGGSGAGTDNISQISYSNRSGSHVWLKAENQMKYPSFVIAPQLPGLYRWDSPNSDTLYGYGKLAVELIEEVVQIYSIDETRIYLTGQSRGGWGVWDIATKRPDLFAAMVPVCGGGNPSQVAAIKDVPVWAFHGRLDKSISVERSRETVEALRQAGGDVKYTEYRFSGHDIWDKAYGEPALSNWLFSPEKGMINERYCS